MMNHEAFNKIYERYYKLSVKVAYDMLRDYEAAQDVAQEVFVKMFQNFDEVDEELVKAWIVLNTKRKAIDYHRRLHGSREMVSFDDNLVRMESPYGRPDMLAEELDRERLRHKIYCRLKEKNLIWYNLIVRVVVENENPEQVAAEYNLTVMHMRTTIHRARVWIRKEFGAEYEDLNRN